MKEQYPIEWWEQERAAEQALKEESVEKALGEFPGYRRRGRLMEDKMVSQGLIFSGGSWTKEAR